MNKDKPITQYDVARELGISQATVARVVNNEPNVKEETRKLVLDKLNELGYRTNYMASNLARKNNPVIKVNILLSSAPQAYWDLMIKGIKTAFSEMDNVSIEYKIDRVDYSINHAVSDHLNILLQQEMDYLIVFPENTQEVIDALKKLQDKEVKIIFLNDYISDFDFLYYVGSDNEKSGKMAGELMGKFLNASSQERSIYILGVYDDVLGVYDKNIEIKSRLSGFSDVINNEFSGIQVNYLFCNPKNESLYDFTKKVIERNSDIIGIYSVDGYINDVGMALNDLKRSDIVFVGHEVYSEVPNLLNKGVIDATISQAPFDQGFLCVKILNWYITRKIDKNNEKYYVDYSIVMKNNQSSSNQEILDMIGKKQAEI